MYEKVQESGPTEIIPLRYVSAVWASVLCYHILSFLGAHHGKWLQSDGGWIAGILSFLSPRSLQLSIAGGCIC